MKWKLLHKRTHYSPKVTIQLSIPHTRGKRNTQNFENKRYPGKSSANRGIIKVGWEERHVRVRNGH
jgi:hypothetical protein